MLLDSFLRMRGPVSPSPEILLVEMDARSALEMQRKSGVWQRQDFAKND